MAKRQRRRSYRRSRRHGSRHKLTPLRILKLGIAVAPVAASVFDKAKSGDFVGVGDVLSSAYTGYVPSSDTFDAMQLKRGYIPLIGAWVFGKVASRVLR